MLSLPSALRVYKASGTGKELTLVEEVVFRHVDTRIAACLLKSAEGSIVTSRGKIRILRSGELEEKRVLFHVV
jgi:hypothetical protein